MRVSSLISVVWCVPDNRIKGKYCTGKLLYYTTTITGKLLMRIYWCPV